jgi:hypothetical protein
MKVRELIDLLATFPQDADVVIPDLCGLASPYYFAVEAYDILASEMADVGGGCFNMYGHERRTLTVRLG